MLEPFIFLLELLFFEHRPRRWVVRVLGLLRARTWWLWLKTLARRLRNRGTVLPLSGSSLSMTIGKAALTVAPPELPPGTASAIAMAMQPPPPRPRFVNSNDSAWLLQEYARQQAEGRFALAATQRAFSVALSVPPSAPTTFVLN